MFTLLTSGVFALVITFDMTAPGLGFPMADALSRGDAPRYVRLVNVTADRIVFDLEQRTIDQRAPNGTMLLSAEDACNGERARMLSKLPIPNVVATVHPCVFRP